MKKLKRWILWLFLLIPAVAQGQPLISFNAGELSPLLKYRLDYENRYLGCATVENLIVKPQGAAVRRPGTYYIAQTKDNGAVILVSFIYSATDAYVLEFGNLYIRFYRNGGQVLDGNNNPYEVDTVYIGSQLEDLHFVQSNDVIYIFHPDVPTYKLSRSAHTSWTIAAVDWQKGPFRDGNTTESTTITPSATTGAITLNASTTTMWDEDHVGALWQISHLAESEQVSGRFWAGWSSGDVNTTDATGDGGAETYDANSSELSVYNGQSYTVTTGGDWWATLSIQRSFDDGTTWKDVKSFTYRGNGNILWEATEDVNDALYRLHIDDQLVTSHMHRHKEGECDFTLATDPFTRDGIVEITAYTDANTVSATVIKDLHSMDATWWWSEGAWSDYRGYPRTGCLYQNRLACAGSESLPRTIWLSRSFDFENMNDDATDDGAIVYEMAGVQQNKVLWLAAKNGILAGTSGSVMRVVSADGDNTALTYANITAEQISTSSSTNLQPASFADTLMFLDRDKRKVRRLFYDLQSNETIAQDMTMAAEHITESGIVDMDHQAAPDPILWAVRADGVLLSMTYDAQQRINGWARHPFETAPGLGGVLSGGTLTVTPSLAYPILDVADGTFAAQQADPGLTQTSAISNVDDLQAMANDLTGNYYLTGDIDASATSTWNAGAGFAPVGAYSLTLDTEFAGTLDGCGYTITGLYINRPTTDCVGLFGAVSAWNSADVKIANLTIADCNITGENYAIGALIGEVGATGSSNQTLIYNCHVEGDIAAVGSAGNDFGIGGMIGVVSISAGAEALCYDSTADCNATTTGTAGFDQIGGFIGYCTGGGFYNCRASGAIVAHNSYDTIIGGFVGQADAIGATAGIYQDCSATGNVSGHDYIGGFCGIATAATFTRCSARGNATAYDGVVGGFVANTYGTNCAWTDCYAWGDATDSSAGNSAGGFIGETNANTTFTNAYAIGIASGYVDPTWGSTGGFMGWDFGGSSTYTDCFWDTETSGLDSDGHAGGAVGHITSWMQTKTNYEDAGWDFDTVWYGPDDVTTDTTYDYTDDELGINSVAVIPADDAEDEVWLAVTRVIDNTVTHTIEQMQPQNWGTDQNDIFFVDCGLTYDGDETTTLTGLTHLAGETVTICGDGGYYQTATVTEAGKVTLNEAMSVAHAGLSYTSTLTTFPIETQQSMGYEKRMPQASLGFYKSLMCEFGREGGTMYPVTFDKSLLIYGGADDLYTGYRRLAMDTQDDEELAITIQQTQPFPMAISQIVPRVEISER